ncbi:MAG: CRISPR-associated endonuclease Cas1 [Methanomicrobiales archaeon]|nr:CRISPR-associated endonuclease Cas1 [Methanomicrobiales archaeon]
MDNESSVQVPWVTVTGFGHHIRSTQAQLQIQKEGRVQVLPLAGISHLLIVGGHHLHTSAVINLLKRGASISFFDADGTPLGFLHPHGDRPDEQVRRAQASAPAHRYAVAITTAAMRARLMRLERLQEEKGDSLFYQGEREVLQQSLAEVEFLVKLDEIRRIATLSSDMYYEVVSRTLPPELGFRRRTRRPHQDPVNAMLSLGYAVLYSQCCLSLTGARLDPERGMLHEGAGGLVYDLMESLKPRMVDEVVFAMARRSLSPDDYECSPPRCHLSEDSAHRLVQQLHASIGRDEIDAYAGRLLESVMAQQPFTAMV